MAAKRRRFWYHPIRVQLTLAGWLFLIVTVLVGLATVKSQAPLSFIVFGGMLGALAVSAIVSWRMVRSVRLQRDAPQRVWQNRTGYLTYALRNRGRRLACLALRAEERSLRDVDFAPAYCVNLAAGGVFRSGARFAPRRRGRLTLGRIRLSTTFPFGLVRASRLLQQDAELLVWPARGRLRRPLLRRGAVTTSSASPAPVQGGQDEFFGLREYRTGDNPRWIHWRRSAGRLKPVVREMARPLPDVLWVIVDGRGGDAGRERALRFAATLVDHAFSQGYKVGLALGAGGRSTVLPPAGGLGQRRKVLDALGEAGGGEGPPLRRVLAELRGTPLRDAQVVAAVVDGGEALRPLRAAAGSLTVLGPRELAEAFEDNPLCREGPR